MSDKTSSHIAPEAPPCGMVGCEKDQRSHTHTGPLCADERVVIWPTLPTAPAWAYVSPPPVGTVVRTHYDRCTVKLDDGTIRELDLKNVKRKRTFRLPKVRRFPKPLHRPHKPLDEGPWHEPPLFGADQEELPEASGS